MALIPKKYFLTKGVGIHEKEMRAFENALRDAGVQMCNLVKISSIIAPHCERITLREGKKFLKPGLVTFSVIAQSVTNQPGQLIGAGIALAQPKDRNVYGYLTEVEEAIGRTDEDIAQDAEEMAIENLVSEWGSDKFEGDSIWKKGKKNYSYKGREFEVDNIVQTARGGKDNKFTVVFVAAIFIYD
jgi:arginine decarboxylase